MSSEPPILPGQPNRWYPLVRPCKSVQRIVVCRNKDDDLQTLVAQHFAELQPGQAMAVLHRRTRLQAPAGSWSETFLLLPAGGGSRALLSIESPEAFRLGLPLLPGGRLRTRLMRACLRAPAVAPILSLQRRERVSMLIKPVDKDDLADWQTFKTPMAVVEGVPGPLQKLVVLHRDHGHEHIYKIAGSEYARRAITHEIQALTSLKGSGLAPHLVARDYQESPHWFAQETLHGRRPKTGITIALMTWLTSLAARDHDHYAPHEVMPSLYDGRDWGQNGSEFGRLADLARQFLQGGSIPCTQSHGDLTPWNARIRRSSMIAFDWEFYNPQRPALFDLFHYLLQSTVLLQQMPAHQGLEWALKVVRTQCQPLLHIAGVSEHEVVPLAALYVLIISERDAILHRIERPKYAQVGWLSAARSRWARDLCDKLDPLMSQNRFEA